MILRSDESCDDGVEYMDAYNDQRSPAVRDVLLTDHSKGEVSVSLLYLLALTCGLGG